VYNNRAVSSRIHVYRAIISLFFFVAQWREGHTAPLNPSGLIWLLVRFTNREKTEINNSAVTYVTVYLRNYLYLAYIYIYSGILVYSSYVRNIVEISIAIDYVTMGQLLVVCQFTGNLQSDCEMRRMSHLGH